MATWPMTNSPRRRPSLPLVADTSGAFMTVVSSLRAARMAGANPNSSALTQRNDEAEQRAPVDRALNQRPTVRSVGS